MPGQIMILDDDPVFARTLADYFRANRYEVIEVNNLEDAINRYRRKKPKVVLLDFNMPITTGDKFLPILQSMEPLVKAIIVTGEMAENVEENFKGLGYYAFFEKGGLSLEKLRAKVDEAFKEAEKAL